MCFGQRRRRQEFLVVLGKRSYAAALIFFLIPMHKMESRIYRFDRRVSMVSVEVLQPADALIHTKEVLTLWDLKNKCNYQEPLLIPSPEVAEYQGLMEPGFHGSLRTTSADKPMEYALGSKISDGRTGTSISCLFGQKELLSEAEWGSKDSSSVIDTGSQHSSFINLKLGRLVDFKDAKNDKCPKDTRSSLSTPSTLPTKTIRSTGLNGQIRFCQVLGCNMDLSSSKDYHKKHKVCEIHSKTAKVIVDGIEQRFCQQCSRFHLLAEFDDGKRSCRRRLAGHNERRRKPQLDIHSGRTGKLLQSHYGRRSLDASMPVRKSFLSTEIYPSGILNELAHENADWCWHVKVVDKEFPINGQTPMPTVSGQLLTKPFLPHYSSGKQFSSIHDVGCPSINISYERGDQIHQGNASNRSNIQVFPRARESICAPSLLSSQSQNASGHSSAIPMVQPVIFPDGQAQDSITQFSDEPLPVISQASMAVASNRFSSGMNSGEYEQMGLLVSDTGDAVNFEFQKDAVYQDSQFMNAREPLSPEPGNTVNLIQLSSLLQRAEEQRMSLQAKQEYVAFNLPSYHTSAMMVKGATAHCL